MGASNDLLEMLDVEGQEAKEAGKAVPEATTEPVVEPETPVEPEAPVEPVEPTDDPEAPSTPVEGEDALEGVTEGEAPVDPATLYMGKYKTAEDMATAFSEYQSHSDKQIAEVNAKNEAYEQMASLEHQQQQQLMQMEQAQQQAPQVSPEDLAAGVEQAPIDTYKWAVENSPDSVPKLIAQISEKHGNELGMELQGNWTQVQLFAQQQQMQDQMQAQYEQIMGPQVMKQSMLDGIGKVEEVYKEDFKALRKETAENLAKLGQLQSYDPDTIARAVETSFLQAHRERAVKAVGTKTQSRTPAPSESVETGTPGTAPKLSEEQQIFNEVLGIKS